MEKQERIEALTIISNQVGNYYTPEQIGIVQKNIAKGTSNTELAYFLNVCKTMDLNPFNKEVWCYKDNKGNLLIFAGRDGFLSKAQKNPFFNGIRSIAVYEKDEFTIDVINNVISHKITKAKKDRGQIIYGIASVFRKDGEPTIEIADFATYNKGYNTWRTHPEEMIKKVAESHALKKAFGISGIQSEYDFNYDNGVAVPLKKEKEITLEDLKEVFEQKRDKLNPEDEMYIERIIEEKETASYKKAYKNLKRI